MTIGPRSTPYARLGHDGAVALARRSYDPMDAHEPELRDAWIRCMNAALAHESVAPDVRAFLERRFAEVAELLRNR